MSIDVPDSIKAQTTSCPDDFGRLTTGRCGDRSICAVDYAYGENVLRLSSAEQPSCPYHVAFEYSQLCTCPVRAYLDSMKHFGIG